MKNPFHDPIQPKEKTDGQFEFSFKAPTYDRRTSRSIPAGDYYGVGFRTPMGKEKASSMASGPIPQSSMCLRADDVIENKEPR